MISAAAFTARRSVPTISNARLSSRTDDRLSLTDAERANVTAAIAGTLPIASLTKRELRGVAQSHRAAMQDAGIHAR